MPYRRRSPFKRRVFDRRIDGENVRVSPMELKSKRLKVDRSAEVTISGTLSGMEVIEIDRDAKVVVHGDLSNIRRLDVDRRAKLIVKGAIHSSDTVQADRDGEIRVSNSVQDVRELEADRRSDISVDGHTSQTKEVEKRGGTIAVGVEVEEDEDTEEDSSSGSLGSRGYDKNRLDELETISVNMPDSHLAVWIQCRILGVDVSGKDFEIMYQQYPELADILKKVDSVDKAIELSRKNADIEFTEHQVEMMRRAENVSKLRETDDVIEAITEAVDAAELRQRIDNNSSIGEEQDESDDSDEEMSVL